jgi:hypothetical protein
MLDRRSFIAVATASALWPGRAFGESPRVHLSGGVRQGELLVGHAEPGTAITLDGQLLLVSPDGSFGFGFPYDRKIPSDLNFLFADGSTGNMTITPVVREYEIQRISGLPQNYVSPPPDILDRIKRESDAMRQARAPTTPHPWFAETFDWPVPGIISSLFGSQRILNGEPRAPHLAVDIAAPEGTPIHAPADGIVSLTDEFYLDGGFTIVDHGHGVSTCYGHQSKRLVTLGDRIARGQIIGEVGQTGRATGPNLHWGMNWFQVGLDPSLSVATPKPPRV